MQMQIITGKIKSAQKVVIYGPEGIGKSTFAAKAPEALFIDTEGSTVNLNVARLNKPSSWTMLMEQVGYVKSHPQLCRTLIIDTADWAERLCSDHICAQAKVDSIEAFGYGKGYTRLEEEFGKLLNLLQDVIDIGINVVLTAHAQMRKFEQPDEMGAYDRWELKLEKKTSALTKEWADMVLFANYKTLVINVDNQGAQKGKNKAQGGSRVMYTSHHPCWDAKNRADLPLEMPFDFSGIAHLFNSAPVGDSAPTVPVEAPVTSPAEPANNPPEWATTMPPASIPASIPTALADLMKANQVASEEIQAVVAQRGYYPIDTPIKNYDASFIAGVLVGAWPQVFGMITARRKEGEIPFNT